MEEKKCDCSVCSTEHDSPVECGCDRCLGDNQMATVIEQYTRGPDGTIEKTVFVGGPTNDLQMQHWQSPGRGMRWEVSHGQ